MPGLVFKNLMKAKVFNNRRIAIYYLNNLHPLHNRFDLDSEDTIKALIKGNLISASEIDDDIVEYFNTKLKDKPNVYKLAKEHFIHQPHSHTFRL